MIKKLTYFAIFLFLVCSLIGAFFSLWAYQYYSRDLPQFTSIEDYQPPMVSSIYANDGSLVAEFYKERRYPVNLKEVPLHVRQAFLAAEDSSFYQHPGIDLIGILRAFIKNIQAGSATQGASTITQQVIKNMLLSSEKKLERKIKEAILAYRLEKRLSKDEIFELYLNQIYLGNRSYGIKSAAKLYFKKELSDLTLAEGALLAGLPKAPSKYSPIKNKKAAKDRQLYVLKRMLTVDFISKENYEKAKNEELKIYKANQKTILKAPYYLSEIRRLVSENFNDLNLNEDGLSIHTALDLNAYNFAQKALRDGVEAVDKRQGWRGALAKEVSKEDFQKKYSLEKKEGFFNKNIHYPALVLRKDNSKAYISLGKTNSSIAINKSEFANKIINKDGEYLSNNFLSHIEPNSVLEVEFLAEKNGKFNFQLSQTPILQSALTLIDPNTGFVPVVIGGYQYSDSQFNRATQAKRQPGSSFKPVVYLSAIDAFEYTPATIVYDEPRAFYAGNQYWKPENYDENYLGPITLRSALEKSRNLISADIISRIGVDTVIAYARKLGIESKLGHNLSLSLGSSEVTLLEMSRAYGVFSTGGILAKSVFITKIQDRKNNVIYDYQENALNNIKQVIDSKSAFIMANMMKGVVEHGTGWRAKTLKRPIAAKTGTSNDQMDAWFIGYTPEWVCGVWSGHDIKKSIGKRETGGSVSAPIWINFMDSFLKEKEEEKYQNLLNKTKEDSKRLGIEFYQPKKLEPLDFTPPKGVKPVWIDKFTGYLSNPNKKNAFLEYFREGKEPKTYQPEVKEEEEELSYWDDPLL